jgi:hypothetical protein
MATKTKTPFEVLSQVNLNDKVKVKPNASKAKYITWSDAWAEVKKHYPNANWEVQTYWSVNESGVHKPYLSTSLGIMVGTKVTIDGLTHTMQLPVLDSGNNALKEQPYTISTKYGSKSIKAATMFDINTSIMRCLVKNLSLFGLGLYIYTDDTMPESNEVAPAKNQVRSVITTDHELFPQVKQYVITNAKKKDWQLIMKQLKSKYSISDNKVLAELQKAYGNAK